MSAVNKNILIVEDDDAIRSSLRDILEVEGYAVFEAMNGKVALQVLPGIHEPSAVLLDLMMPEMNGYQFLEIARADANLKERRIIIMSASRDAQRFAQENKCAFIKKPLDIDQLLVTIENELPKSS